MKKKVISLLIIILLLPVIPVLAYYMADIIITNSSSTNYGLIGVTANGSFQDMIDYGFFTDSNGLDARVLKGSTEQPFTLFDKRINVATDINSNSSITLTLTTDNNIANNFSIVPGHGGYITTPDNASIEPGNNASIRINGIYLSETENITSKAGAYFITYNSGNVSATIPGNNSSTFYTYTGTGSNINMYTGSTIRSGQVINITTNCYIIEATFKLYRSGNPGGSVYARVYDYSTKNLIGTIGSMLTSSISAAGGSSYTFNSTPISVTPGQYAVILENDNGDSSNYIRIYYDTNAEAGFRISSTSSVWTDHNTEDSYGTVKITTSESVLTSSVSIGKHNVWLNIDPSNYHLIINGIETDNITLISSIPDTSSNTIWLLNCPYADNISIYTSGTRQLYYAPNTLLTVDSSNLTAALPDREGSNTGNITLGTNPTNVSLALGQLDSDYQTNYTTGDTQADIVPTNNGSLSVVKMTDAQMEAGLSGDIFYPLMVVIANNISHTSVLFLYQFATVMISMVILVILLLVPQFGFNMALASFIVCIFNGIAISKGIMYPWVMLLLVPVCIFFIITEGRRLVS